MLGQSQSFTGFSELVGGYNNAATANYGAVFGYNNKASGLYSSVTGGDANTASAMYPDQSLYPANAAPELVKRINRTLQRADQIEGADLGVG